jgi:hypothetical protein
MTVRRGHLVVALAALAAAVLYNVWYFVLRPAAPAGSRPVIEQALPVSAGPARPAAAAADPLAIPAPPPVDMASPPSWRRDPFLFGDETRTVARQAVPAPPLVEPAVRSILYSASRRLAVVDGRIVGVGDAAGEYTVVEIEQSAVVFAAPSGGRIRVPVHGPGPQGPVR